MTAIFATTTQLGGGSNIVAYLVIGVVVIGYAIAKRNAYRATKCMHCGHDNGLTGWQASICPACGRNKTVFNSQKARKR